MPTPPKLAAAVLFSQLSCAAAFQLPASALRRSPQFRRSSSISCAMTDEEWAKRWPGKTPEEIENMKKWGKILSSADTFDEDYLKKSKPARGGKASSASGGSPGIAPRADSFAEYLVPYAGLVVGALLLAGGAFAYLVLYA